MCINWKPPKHMWEVYNECADSQVAIHVSKPLRMANNDLAQGFIHLHSLQKVAWSINTVTWVLPSYIIHHLQMRKVRPRAQWHTWNVRAILRSHVFALANTLNYEGAHKVFMRDTVQFYHHHATNPKTKSLILLSEWHFKWALLDRSLTSKTTMSPTSLSNTFSIS
jgi:hypothetical protein